MTLIFCDNAPFIGEDATSFAAQLLLLISIQFQKFLNNTF